MTLTLRASFAVRTRILRLQSPVGEGTTNGSGIARQDLVQCEKLLDNTMAWNWLISDRDNGATGTRINGNGVTC